ncbi:conserved hypothetical protein; putative membrane protein [Cupriavidus taiwanensis]|uniref:hypothetical protein n=1 Tax=Cupriavidus taiwanensis TaxID=164546 RepID=UPI000E15EE24|nr:hypothetical protein [Cupriavidus taiwanensis]SPA18636.1 conserved hypothetical protein; putative membrane protein [Cupriavidus taiwanensis]
MKGADLDYARAPRPALVFGCLMPAPWLGAAAGLLLAAGPATGLPDRFAPLALAAVHALALGMLLPVMVGALFQMMPVVARVDVPGAGRLAPFMAATGAAVAAALGFGLLGGEPAALRVAAALGAVLLLAGAALLAAGRRVAAVDATTRTLAGIGAPLVAALLAGIALAGTFGGLWRVPVAQTLGLHMAWALGGWLAALVSGVAATVLPMFWQTPRAPAALARWLPLGHWGPLAVFSAALVLWPGEPVLARAALVVWLSFVAVLGACGLAGTLRARRRHDPLWLLWPVACASMLVAAVLAAAAVVLPGAALPLAWWAGTMALVGVGVLPVTAMLGKIVPFLVWLHLRRLLPPRARVPAMQAIIAPGGQRGQAWLLLAAYAVLLALPLAPALLARVGGLLLAGANAWLGWQLLAALRCMRQMRKCGGLPPRVVEGIGMRPAEERKREKAGVGIPTRPTS